MRCLDLWILGSYESNRLEEGEETHHEHTTSVAEATKEEPQESKQEEPAFPCAYY